MRIAVVVNSNAGSLIGGVTSEMLEERLAAAGIDAFLEPDGSRPLAERIDAAAASGVDAVVVAGGDGTIACAAQALAGTDIAFGILPLGTMNMLARDIGVPIDLAAAITALAGGVVRRIDVGEVNGHVFLCNSVLGLASRLGVRRERERGKLGIAALWRMAVVAWRSARRYPAMTVDLEIGGRRRRLSTRAIAVVDNDYGEAPGRLFARPRLDSGELVLYVTERMTPWRLVALGFGLLVGRWRDRPGLTRITATEFTIHSRRKLLRIMNDGESLLVAPPLRYRIRPGALKVIVPPEAAADAAGGAAEPGRGRDAA